MLPRSVQFSHEFTLKFSKAPLRRKSSLTLEDPRRVVSGPRSEGARAGNVLREANDGFGSKLAVPTLPGERPDWAKLEYSGGCKSQGKMTNSYRCTQLKCGRMDTPATSKQALLLELPKHIFAIGRLIPRHSWRALSPKRTCRVSRSS